MNRGCWIFLVISALGFPGGINAEGRHELKVHLAQANNQSPYAFVRAKFEPGELADPWAVRFFDEQGAEVPYFVWDSVSWRVAREGRADWGHRYALINHAPGNSPDVLQARGEKIAWAKKKLPALGKKLEAREDAAKRAGDSVCGAIYLLRRRVPAFGKERLTLRLYPERQVEPQRKQWNGPKSDGPIAAVQGRLGFQDLPDFEVSWSDDKVSLKVAEPATLRLFYRTLRPDWPPESRPVLQRRDADGNTKTLRDAEWDSTWVEWRADRGVYELRSLHR